jgi:peptidylprolyl isomerase
MRRQWGIPAAVLVLVIAVAVAGCGSGSSSSTSSGAELETATPAQAAKRPEPKAKLPSGAAPKKLVTDELIEGTGPEAKQGGVATVQYAGYLFKGGKQFVSSWSGTPITFTIGKNEVIPGWDEGVVGMKAGGRRELVVPPELAYGSEEIGPIPANSTLVFYVDLLSVS